MPRAATTSDRPAGQRRPAWTLALLAIVLAACTPSAPPRTEQLLVFGTTVDIELRDAPPEQAQAALTQIAVLLNRREREWHAWENSDITRINAALAAGRAAEAPASVIALVERSQQLSQASDGLYDPAIGGLIGAWGFHTSAFPVLTPAPSREWLAAWRSSRPRIVDLDIRGSQLSTRNRRTQLDFAAIAEGAAAESVLGILREHRIRHALVSMGGDVVALGDGDGAPWQVAVRDPFEGILAGVELRDGEALFSTGNYSKFRESPTGSRWSHILDPRTGYPARGSAAVVVLHTDPVLADAAATALFVGGPAGFERLVRALRLGCAVMVTEENELLVTSAMKQRLTMLRDPVPLGAPLDMGEGCSGR
jgi:thiamine biosynthesis lipoprotein